MSKTISWSLRILKIKKGVTFDNLSYFFLNSNLTGIKVHKCELYNESISNFFLFWSKVYLLKFVKKYFFLNPIIRLIKITAIED